MTTTMTMRGTEAGGVLLLALLLLSTTVARAEDPYVFMEWHVTYGTKNIVGTPQKVILINGEFPGPRINCSSNNNIVINVFNQLDQPLLFTWNGIQHRKNSWQDGLPGTNCPVAPGTNYTYHWQPKDQIGTFFYFPSIGMQRVVGGFGLISVLSRLLIPVPYDPPADDLQVLIGDWFTKDHAVMASLLDAGRNFGRPAGVLINGRGGKEAANPPMFTWEAAKTYQLRICNVGIKTSLNFRIQGHDMKLVEMDGSHTVQGMYESLDVHVGQCMAVLVDADQKPADYLMVASTRFMAGPSSVSAVIRYAGSNTPPAANVPEPPAGWAWSINQWRSFRWNLTASAARPNPQGSYHYGQINITRTIKLMVTRGHVEGKLKYGFNGVSHVDGDTPLKLAEYFNVSDQVFKYNQMGDEPPAVNGPMHVVPNVITAEFRTFIEVVFENPEKSMESMHIDGYAFFAVGMGPGKWTAAERKTYNLLDAVSRHTIQVYPRSWSAVMLTFDNAGMWNVRSNLWERHYLGEQLYMSVVSPARSLRDEYNMPENALRCGKVVGLSMPPSYLPA
ncbi:L-ascorbate oxidase homolog [Aegilops tauschii subsp. strangulata]|uniref:L-ascorbate oxidase-like protein n=1 Tax=Aegilops tauschii subsp. strangulata TaxID=200361 RepID=A0A452ZD92_AEGTS|nr:L-ascorbate oxidase homolog [Aegilops tauschii subsp. strangulata]